MNENQLLKVSFFGSIIGIIMLYFIAMTLGPAPVKIGEVTGDLIGKAVLVEGTVSDLHFHEDGHIFFNLGDDSGETIKVVLWEETVKQLDLNRVNIREVSNGDRLQITGEVELYKGTLEIIPLRAQVIFLE